MPRPHCDPAEYVKQLRDEMPPEYSAALDQCTIRRTKTTVCFDTDHPAWDEAQRVRIGFGKYLPGEIHTVIHRRPGQPDEVRKLDKPIKVQSKPDEPLNPDLPGDWLALLIEREGLGKVNNCACQRMRKTMNEWGWAGCWANRQTIGRYLIKEQQDRSLGVPLLKAKGYLHEALDALRHHAPGTLSGASGGVELTKFLVWFGYEYATDLLGREPRIQPKQAKG